MHGASAGAAPGGDRPPKGPVTWLLGSQLLSGLQKILLYTITGKKFPGLRWMRPEVLRIVGPPPTGALEAEAARAAGAAAGGTAAPASDQPFWFDYLSDTGDSPQATYSLARLCLNHLALETKDGRTLVTAAPSQGTIADPHVLPRGTFLLVGGDTAYHVADYATLNERVVQPFERAYLELVREGSPLASGGAAAQGWLFGIPGNHDYYDLLDGFNRQFRQPVEDELTAHGMAVPAGHAKEQLVLPSFVRRQHASYLALELPHGWKLCALDLQGGYLNYRQKLFFRSFLAAGHERLILATPEPGTVFGQEVEPVQRMLVSLGLPRPEPARPAVTPTEAPRSVVKNTHCRLDLAGDVHHYARYWGGRRPTTDEPPSNYASVVAGLGGAFLHPSETRTGETAPHHVYPREEVSRAAVYPALFRPWVIMRGGYLWVIGGVMAALVYFCATVPPSTRQLLGGLVELAHAHLGAGELRTGLSPGPLAEMEAREEGVLWILRRRTEALEGGTARALQIEETGLALSPEHMDWAERLWLGFSRLVQRPGADVAMQGLVIALFAFAWWYQAHRMARHKARREARERGMEEPLEPVRQRDLWPTWLALSGATLGVLTSFLEIFTMVEPAFAGSLREAIFMLSDLLLAALGLWWRAGYLEALREKARQVGALRERAWQAGRLGAAAHEDMLGPMDRLFAPFLIVFVLLCCYVGIWRHGRYPAALLLTNLMFLALCVGVPLGAIALAVWSGAVRLGWRRRWPHVLIGLGHGLLQVLVPLLWTRLADAWLLLGGLGILGAWTLLGRSRWLQGRRLALALAGLGLGLLLCLVPLVFGELQPLTALSLVRAGLVGALTSATIFGAYLAVSLSFDGHNNEAGGAARVERYKQLLRIKLEKDKLTVYVIAVDDPRHHPHEAHLEDCFELAPLAPTPAGDEARA